MRATSTIATAMVCAAAIAACTSAPVTTSASERASALDLPGASRPVVNGTGQRRGRLFPPQDLDLLEFPDRAAWQRPDQVMDALSIADGSVVADIGAGAGWFTMRLAQRVGPNGTVYSQDIQRPMLEAIRRRVARDGLRNVQVRLGEGINPNLPSHLLDAVLVVDTYQEVEAEDRVPFLRNLATTLKPNGRIGIVNHKPGSGGPGPAPAVRVESGSVESDAHAAGLRVLTRATLPYQYLLVLGKG